MHQSVDSGDNWRGEYFAVGTIASNHATNETKWDFDPFDPDCEEYVVNEGETLLIPKGWSHLVMSEPYTIAVSFMCEERTPVKWRRDLMPQKNMYLFRRALEQQLDLASWCTFPCEGMTSQDAQLGSKAHKTWLQRDLFDGIFDCTGDEFDEHLLFKTHPTWVFEYFFVTGASTRVEREFTPPLNGETCTFGAPKTFMALLQLAKEHYDTRGTSTFAMRAAVVWEAIQRHWKDLPPGHSDEQTRLFYASILNHDEPIRRAWHVSRSPTFQDPLYGLNTPLSPERILQRIEVNNRIVVARELEALVRNNLDSGYRVSITHVNDTRHHDDDDDDDDDHGHAHST
jgi:hypothetical protein